MKTVKLSQFNPNNVPEEYLGTFIEEVSYDAPTGIVTITFSDQTTKDLPTLLPAPVRNLTSADIVDGVLTIYFDDATSFVVGDISDTNQVEYPTRTGTGILTDSETGVYKTLESIDPNLTITPTADQLVISATLEAGGAGTEYALSAFKVTDLKVNVTGTAGLYQLPSVADTFNRLSFNRMDINDAAASNVDGVVTLQPGNYYVDCKSSSYHTGLTYLVVRKVSDQSELLRGVAANASASQDVSYDVLVSGYLNFDVVTEIEVVQYTELADAGGLVKVDLVEAFDLEATVATLTIYKTSSTALPNQINTPTEPVQPAIVTAIRNMANTYADRTPTERKLFDEIQPDGFYSTIHSGDYVYLLGGNSESICKWNTVDDSVSYLKIPGMVANAYRGAILVDGWIYLIPYNASQVCRFNVSTEMVEFTDYGLSLGEVSKWCDAVHCPITNKIYAIPERTSTFLIIDVANQTAERAALGATFTTAAVKFSGGVYVDGEVYCIPSGMTSVVIIDTVANTATNNTYGLTLTDTFKWWGGVYLPTEQKIVGIPYSSTDILVIDVAAQTAVRTNYGATLTGATKWRGAAALAANGKVYAMPGTANDILEIDVVAQTAVRSPFIRGALTATSKFNDAVLVNNTLYCANHQYYDNLVRVDLSTLYSTLVDPRRILINYAQNYMFSGNVRAPNDVVYTIPYQLSDAYAIDVPNNRMTRLPWPNAAAFTASMYNGAAVGVDGNVYFAPHSGASLNRIVPANEFGTPREKVAKQQLDIVPPLTADTDSGYVVSASGFTSTNNPFKAFDGVIGTTGSIWQTAATADPKWIKVELPIAKAITAFRYRSSSNYYMRLGTLEGSNDDVQWTTLAKIRSTNSVPWELSPRYWIDDVTAYKYYRLVVTDSISNIAAISEIHLLEDDAGATDQYEALLDVADHNCPTQQILGSSQSSTSYYAYKLSRSTHPTAAADGWISASIAGPHWVYFNFREAIRITSIAAWNLDSAFPGQFILEASNDDVNFVQLLDVTLATQSIPYSEIGEFYFENPTSYKIYRLVVYPATGSQVRLGRVSLRTPVEYDASNWWGRWDTLNWNASTSLSGSGKWAGAARDPSDGKIYLIPYTGTDIGIIDPAEKTFVRTTFGLPGIAGGTKYSGGVFSPYDGKLYCIPFTAVPVLIIDPSSEKYTQGYLNSNIGFSFSHNYATLGPDGAIYSGPNASLNVLRIDTELQTTTDQLGAGVAGSNKTRGTSLGPNGKIYGIPYARNYYEEYDTDTFEYAQYPTADTQGSSYSIGSSLLSNGMIVTSKYINGTAADKSCVYVLDFGEGITIAPEIINHPSVK